MKLLKRGCIKRKKYPAENRWGKSQMPAKY